ncbi:vacuolar protein sorting-associated protein 72 homolog isoform X2 [Cimex lectularius]|uniref:Vacuolar protein sorting-associated protein 72 homolog n=1 Tax=Cimex lectularius TaxID=79782 RepID=A0A8I6RMV3_CIMLE|nr:vacuolar protein sorting-associated protein 72 homolog isoform X2 [Cimex lectularius]
MAATRERRVNAGNKLSKLLNEEEEDDFYKTTYGGFEEIENDLDYKSEEECEDVVDSDFSIDENDEVISDHEDDDKKRRKPLVTRAYKEPKPAKKKEVKEEVKNDKKASSKPKYTPKPLSQPLERKSIRKSTAVKSAATAQRVKERKALRLQRKLPKPVDNWKPTQEELLEEAKITEEENIKSLEKFYKMELEKKKNRVVKKTFNGPVIRYCSVSMPLITEIESPEIKVHEEEKKPITTNFLITEDTPMVIDPNENGSTELAGEVEISTHVDPVVPVKTEVKEEAQESKPLQTVGRCERTFITFSDEATFRKAFPIKRPPVLKEPKICPITRLPAKYLDPRTHCAFRNVRAFKVMREAYYMQLDNKIAKGTVDGLNPEELEKWIPYRAKMNQQKSLSNNSKIRIDPATLQLAQIKV